MLKQFIKKSFIFFLPIVLFLTIPSITLFSSKENFYNVDHLLQEPNHDYLIGYLFNEKNYRYIKWAALSARPKQEILALGSSRVLQFERDMFSKSMYNAGFTIESIFDVRPFLSTIPEDAMPHFLILGLDQWMFNANWPLAKTKKDSTFWKSSFSYFPSTRVLREIWESLLKQDIPFIDTTYTDTTTIGFYASLNQGGIRSDGSYSYGKERNHHNFQFTKQKIQEKKDRFESGDIPFKEALEELRHIIHFCKKQNIKVIAFLPPFAPTIHTILTTSPDHHYLLALPQAIQDHIPPGDAEFFDFGNPSLVGGSDNEFFDGYHGNSTLYKRFLLYMIKHNSSLKKVTDSTRLQVL